MGPRTWVGRMRRPARSVAMLVLVVSVVLAVGPGSRAGPTFPLDDYPGFGRSADAALRDDTIAYWEAYRRELIVRECMAAAGFSYELTVAYPHAEIVWIADGLGIDSNRVEAEELSPAERNRAYESGLSPADRDRYFRALFGEAAADVDEANRSGMVPRGRNRVALEEVADRYAGVVGEISRDERFLDYLGAHAALARAVLDADGGAPAGLDNPWSRQ